MATIDLQQSLVNRLEALAHSEGVSLEVYLERVAERPMHAAPVEPPLTPQELDLLLESEASHNAAYQGTYSRTDIYREHD